MGRVTTDISELEAAGLLTGVAGSDARSARAALINQLLDEGFSAEQIRAAAEQDRVALLPVERILARGDATLTSAEVAEQTGLELDFLVRLWRALGFAEADPTEPAFDDSDLAAARIVGQFVAGGISSEAIVGITRLIGHDMSRLAEALRSVVGETLLEPGDNELTVGLRYARAAEVLAPLLTPLLSYVLTVHLREQLKTDVISQAELSSGRFDLARDITAAFADLVGFTKLGESVTPSELGAAGTELIELTAEMVSPPVKLVKSVGDGVLLVSTEPEPLVDAVLRLVDAADATDSLPSLRVGVAAGEAIPQAGDWFGRPVNLASRITGIARPSSVLATKEVRDAVPEAVAWSAAGAHRLKGVRKALPLYRARRKMGER
ncbi:MAG TPA: adenylate cyclase regulatory domain-containing protein [Actinomycetota bacterium]|nr:adenylate cyclase regulatory domain-containing protein [Actinomycetota bacterium]